MSGSAHEHPPDSAGEIFSPAVSLATLPDDLLGILCRYLYPSISAYMRFVLSSRKWLNEAPKCLDYVYIDEHTPTSVYSNVSPDTLVLCCLEPPIPSMLPNLLASCKSLIMRSPLGHSNPQFVDSSSFGDCFASVERIDTSEISYPFNQIWPHLKNLRSCKISPERNTLKAICEHFSTLRKLEMRHHGNASVLTVEDLVEYLKNLTCLEELRLDPKQIQVSTSPGAPGISIQHVQKLQQCLPAHLASLERVKVVASRGTSISLPKYLFCLASSPAEWQNVCKARKIKESLPDVLEYLRWAPNLLTESATDQVRHLLAATSSLTLTCGPCNPISSSEIIMGNILFLGAYFDNKLMQTLLLNAIDWSTVTAEHLRDSYGFTPLHYIPKSDQYWRQLYTRLKPLFPNILADDHNIDKSTVAAQLISGFVQGINSPYPYTFGFMLEIFKLDEDAACANNDMVARLLSLPMSSPYYFRDAYYETLEIAVRREKMRGVFDPKCVVAHLQRWNDFVLFRLWLVMAEAIEDSMGLINANKRTKLFRRIIESLAVVPRERVSLLHKFGKYPFDVTGLNPILSTLHQEQDMDLFWMLIEFGALPTTSDLHIPVFLANCNLQCVSDVLEEHFEKLLALYVQIGDHEVGLFSLEAVCQSFMQDLCASIRVSKSQPDCRLIDKLARVLLSGLFQDNLLNALGKDAHGMTSSDVLETLLFVLVGPWSLSYIDMPERLGLAKHIFVVLKARRIEVPASQIARSFDSGFERPTHTYYDFIPKRRRQDQAFLVAAACAYTRVENTAHRPLFQALFDEISGVLANRKGLGSSWASTREIFLATGLERDESYRKMQDVIRQTFWSIKGDPLKSFNPSGAPSRFGQRASGFSAPLAFSGNGNTADGASVGDEDDDNNTDSSCSD